MIRGIYFLAVALVILLPACSSVKTGPTPVEDRTRSAGLEDIEPVSGNHGENNVPGPGRQRENAGAGQASSPAIVALLGEAQRDEVNGNWENAAATLERAIRIEPKNARLWNRLAGLRMRQGQWQQALNLARKSNSLAAGDYDLQLENWQLILEIKQKVNDIQGIRDAQTMIELLRKKGAKGKSG